MCTAIRELSFSERFLNKAKHQRSWTIYTNLELISCGHVVNDIFVLEPESGELMLTLMGAEFTKLHLKLLARTLSRLNNAEPQSQLSKRNDHEGRNSVPDQSYKGADSLYVPIRRDASNASRATANMAEPRAEPNGALQELRGMLSEIFGVSVGEVQRGSALGELGVDSLMATEVISEIKTRFRVAISSSEFQDLTDL